MLKKSAELRSVAVAAAMADGERGTVARFVDRGI